MTNVPTARFPELDSAVHFAASRYAAALLDPADSRKDPQDPEDEVEELEPEDSPSSPSAARFGAHLSVAGRVPNLLGVHGLRPQVPERDLHHTARMVPIIPHR